MVMASAPQIIVCDVNETLLDLAALDPLFEAAFGTAAARSAWFAQMLRDAFVSVITGPYRDFGEIARAALAVTAWRYERPLAEAEQQQLLGAMRRLPPHPDVPQALDQLREAGFRMAALTNSTQDAADAQLAHAGLHGYFEQVMSVEAAGRLKPHPAVYAMAAARLGAAPDQLCLVAAHDWDVAGAQQAGWHAAFVARPGQVFSPLVAQPALVGPDLRAVAVQLIAEVA